MKAPCKVSGGYLNTGWRRDVWEERICQCFPDIFLCVCVCMYVCLCLFGHMALRDCSSLTRDQTYHPLHWESEVLTTGLPGKKPLSRHTEVSIFIVG